MFMRNRLARKMAAEMREATCAGTQTSKAPTLSGPSVTNHYSVPMGFPLKHTSFASGSHSRARIMFRLGGLPCVVVDFKGSKAFNL